MGRSGVTALHWRGREERGGKGGEEEMGGREGEEGGREGKGGRGERGERGKGSGGERGGGESMAKTSSCFNTIPKLGECEVGDGHVGTQ